MAREMPKAQGDVVIVRIYSPRPTGAVPLRFGMRSYAAESARKTSGSNTVPGCSMAA